MKVLFLQRRVHKAGAQVSLDVTISALRQRDIHAQAILGSEGWLTEQLKEKDALCDIVPFPSFRSPLSKLSKLNLFARAADKVWKKHGPFNIIHSNDTWDALLAEWLASRWKLPWVVHLRNANLNEAHYYKYHCNKARAAIAVSPSVYAKVRNWEYSDLRYIPNGLTLEAFHPPSNNNVHFPASVGVIGDGYERKGWIDLAEAFLKLEKIGESLPGKLFFWGAVNEKNLVAIQRKIPQKIKVSFEGHVNDLVEHIRRMDIVIVPSRNESYGRAMVETIAAGVPLLASRTGIIPHILNDDSPWTFHPDNPDSIAEAWMQISKIWPDRVKNLKIYQERLKKEFLIDNIIHKLIDLYKEIESKDA